MTKLTNASQHQQFVSSSSHCDHRCCEIMHVLRGFGNYRRFILTAFLFGVPLFIIILCLRDRSSSNHASCTPFSSRETAIVDMDGKLHTYNRASPLIFIGGFPRSGTTLARAMLDAHTDIRCGEETRVVPRILQLAAQWNRSAKETNRLHEAGLTDQIIADAVAAFILEVVVKHGEPAPRLCNKDPFTLKYGVYLMKIFPNAKFIFMIRDGRAVVHSLIQRKVTVTGFDLTNYRQCLTKWSNSMKTMLRECDEIGPTRCLKVKYEDLVLHPRLQMERILNYLELPWTEDVMHHEQYINKPGGVSLSKVERSSDQVIKPVNVEALTKWVGAIPDDVIEDMANIAPVLETLGYKPNENPPNYGIPDPEVATNTNYVIKEADRWKKNAENLLERSKQQQT